MSSFGYSRELKKYEEVEEDELLATLSSEELQELERELADLDPDDNVPIGLRQKDQTTKTPTGTFDRDALLKYWEDDNKTLLEDDKEESNAGQKGWPDKSRGERVSASSSYTGKTLDIDRKKISNKEKKAHSTFVKNDAKVDEVEKKDECKKEARIVSKCPQKNGLSKSSRVELRSETTDQNLNMVFDRPSGNPIVIDKTLEQILGDDPVMKEVNLNNIEDISQETLLRFAEALCTNTNVHVFSLANTHADDRVAFAISKMLCENCSIRNLNIESNFVSGQGILALLAALQHNRTLMELRFHNQRHICGGKVEMEMVQLLRQNTTLVKLGYQFDLPGPRMTATSILTHNQDQQRQRRLQQKKEQSPLEVSAQVSGLSAGDRPSKLSSQSSKTVENHNRNPPPPASLDPPTRKIAEMVKQQEGSNSTKAQANPRKPKSKKLKNGANEKESADIFKDLKNALKPSSHKRKDEPSHLPPLQRSSHDDLMAAIRGSSIRSLKRGDCLLSSDNSICRSVNSWTLSRVKNSMIG
ncbi:putative leiomodin-2 [Scophthalmus maximus]|uniref:Leiomodin-3 n=1 Tax=Scophthalmus maximus TaxID=52904 RepID=A0A2U9BUZ8_SCOMX|nr:putative leiomodin-2 [Scophthalmus maximus]